jgi:hypothetical protein
MRSIQLVLSGHAEDTSGGLAVETESGRISAYDVALDSQSGLWLAWSSSDVDEGVLSTPFALTSDSLGAVGLPSAPWALTPNVRRSLMEEPTSVPEPLAGASVVAPTDSVSLASLPPSAAAVATGAGSPVAGAVTESVRRTALATEPAASRLSIGAEALDPQDQDSVLRRTPTRRWWTQGAGSIGGGASSSSALASLMERLAVSSILDRTSEGLAREDRAIPQSADAQGRVDALVQAVAALGAAAGGEALRNGRAKLEHQDAALPTAWKRERLQTTELV